MAVSMRAFSSHGGGRFFFLLSTRADRFLGPASENRALAGGGRALSKNVHLPWPRRRASFTCFLSDSFPPRSREMRHFYTGRALISTSTAGTTNEEPAAAGGSGEQFKNDVTKTTETATDEQAADMKILRTLAKHLWLKDNAEFRFRVALALGLLVGAKVINVQVPFLFKLAVDWLSAITGSSSSIASFTDSNSTMLALFVSPAAVLVGYGIARSGATACNDFESIGKAAFES